jgi:hypothetical protein
VTKVIKLSTYVVYKCSLQARAFHPSPWQAFNAYFDVGE